MTSWTCNRTSTACATSLAVAAAAGGPDAEALADRLTAPLDSAIRLALLEALSDAAEEITRELAPASVDVRLRGRDPKFTRRVPVSTNRPNRWPRSLRHRNPTTTAAPGG